MTDHKKCSGSERRRQNLWRQPQHQRLWMKAAAAFLSSKLMNEGSRSISSLKIKLMSHDSWMKFLRTAEAGNKEVGRPSNAWNPWCYLSIQLEFKTLTLNLNRSKAFIKSRLILISKPLLCRNKIREWKNKTLLIKRKWIELVNKADREREKANLVTKKIVEWKSDTRKWKTAQDTVRSNEFN